ncbi:hypothetical protein EWM64_g10567, partial [Hericium alpestre]
MVGDSTNDVGTLKQAHISVALLNGMPEDLQKIVERERIDRLKKVYESQLKISAHFNQLPSPVPPALAQFYLDIMEVQKKAGQKFTATDLLTHKRLHKKQKTSKPAPRKHTQDERGSTSDESDHDRPSKWPRVETDVVVDEETIALYRRAGQGIGRFLSPFLDLKQLAMFYAATVNAISSRSHAALANNKYSKL